MNDVERFLAHAVQLEAEAARRYEDLAAAMTTDGNRELQSFFARMAHYSRLASSARSETKATARCGFRELPALAPHEFEWPDGLSPESADWVGVDAQMSQRAALELALDGERRGHAYYAAIAATTTDIELRGIAQQFADEEAAHVQELEKLLATCPA